MIKPTDGNIYKIVGIHNDPGDTIIAAHDIAEAISIWREYYKMPEMYIETIELIANCLISRT